MAGNPVTRENQAFEFRYRVQDIIVMHLYTVPRTPFFLSFLALVYILFLFFFARQETLYPSVIYALAPTLGCALIGVIGATVPVVFSRPARAARQVEVDESGIAITLADQTTQIEWDQVKKTGQVAGHLFMKLKNGSYLMIPEQACPPALFETIRSYTKKPA